MNPVKRFFLLNSITVLVTIVVTVLAATAFIAVYSNIIDQKSGVSSIRRVLGLRAGFGEIRKSIENGQLLPFSGKEGQDSLMAAVRSLGADVMVLKGRDIVFSSRKYQTMEVVKWLNQTEGVPNTDSIEMDDQSYIFDRIETVLPNGEKGIILVLAPSGSQGNFYLALILFTSFCFSLVFLGMNFWVSLRLSHSVVEPLIRLEKAAVKISEGDLQCEIANEGDQEVALLAKALEKLRVKLLDAVNVQKKYDENRKFLISSISHDLLTPVTNIKGYIEGILDGVAKASGKEEEYLQTALNKTVLLNAMIDDLLLYSNLDLKQMPFHFEKTDIEQYFKDCVSDYDYTFQKDNMNLKLDNRITSPVYVFLDRDQFQRVIQNIFDNAKKYRKQGEGEISISLRETRTSIIIEIRDNGEGIGSQDVSRIFDRFYRSDPARKSAGGSGLGLAICKHIIEGHEGRIWAVSKQGEGTSILISMKKCLEDTN